MSRDKAQEHAQRIATICKTTAREAIDSAHNAPCFVAVEYPDSAIVVYHDEPGTQVSTGNHAGRFVAVTATN